MHKIVIACLCAGLFAPAAFATGPGVDISHLIKSGEWRATSVNITDGHPEKPTTTTSCEHFRTLSDVLGQNDAATSKVHLAHKLEGNHLHVFGPIIVAGRKIGTIDENLFFDSPKAMHGTVNEKISAPGGHIIASLMKIKGQWIGPCKPGEDSGD